MIIYGLVDPRTQQLRYVGKTGKTLAERLKQHLKDSKHKTDHKCRWMQSLHKAGLVPEIFEIESVSGSGDEEEIHHIAQFRGIGCELVNYAPGGRGVTSHTAETKARIGSANRGRSPSAATREAISRAGKGRKFSAEHRARIAAANSRRWEEGKMEGARKKMGESAKQVNARRSRGPGGRFES